MHTMETQLQSLSKIFTERIFRIPDYQRGYAWTHRQLKDFWNDIEQLDDDRNHYTGVLTLEQVPEQIINSWDDDRWIIHAKSYTPFFVVDGQQRLTTAIILIQVILERLSDDQKLNYTSNSEIQKKFIFDSKDDGISRSYIFGYEKDNPSYEFLKTKIFLEHSSSMLQAQETVYTHNLEFAKQYFKDVVADLSIEKLEIIYKKISQNLLFNIFTITDDVDVCVAFETMNNRGKPLSYLELLKNRLIYLSLKFHAPNYEKKELRQSINDCWKSIYHNLGKNKDNPLDDDRFLLNHYITYFSKEAFDYEAEFDNILRYRRIYRADYAHFLLEKKFITKNIYADNTKEKITLNSIYDYVLSLQISVELWYKIYNPFDSDFDSDIKIWLDKLSRLEINTVVPLIMVFFQMESSIQKRISLLKVLERMLFIFSLASYRYLMIPQDHVINYAIKLSRKNLTPDKVIKSINDFTNEIVLRRDYLKTLLSEFRSNGFYKWEGIRYFLFEYNLHLQKKSKTDRPKIFWPEFVEDKKDFISVEHIFPQKARHSYWTEKFAKYNSREKKALRESLGNLLPLSKAKNSSLQNKPFLEKVNGKSDDDFVGYRYGSYAENEVSKCSNWNVEQIVRRGLRLLKFMENRWDITLGSVENKLKFLNVEFVPKREKIDFK